MVRMLLIGYCYSIRSERRLCREVELNLVYRWFCRLGLEDKVPHHHSTFRSIVTAAVERRISNRDETFGNGHPRGVAAPEAGNNAAAGGPWFQC